MTNNNTAPLWIAVLALTVFLSFLGYMGSLHSRDVAAKQIRTDWSKVNLTKTMGPGGKEYVIIYIGDSIVTYKPLRNE